MATDPRRRPSRLLLISGGLVVALVAVIAGVLVSGHHAAASPPKSIGPATSAMATSTQHPAGPKAHAALRVVKVTPAPGAKNVGYDVNIEVKFSASLKRGSLRPSLVPPVAGSWVSGAGNVLRFIPQEPFVPGVSERIVVQAGRQGPVSVNGARLKTAYASSFTIANGTMLRVQQLLAELDYLPYAFAPAGRGSAATRAAAALDKEPTNPGQISRDPAAGSFIARFPNMPSQLATSFAPTQYDAATRGAILAFEADHNLTLDGLPGPKVWGALLNAVAARDATTRPYDYLIVSETQPETLYVWRDGKVIYQTPANTGVEGATTALGTFPVYLRFTSTTMTGTNPDGTKYSDPDIPWVSYFNGSDAVHGFIRPGYGYPQSDGCVELPISHAAAVFPDDPIGTLVTVTEGNLSPELHASVAVYGNAAGDPEGSDTTTSSAPSTTTTSPPPSTTTTTTTLPPAKKRPAPTTTVPPTTLAPTTTVPVTTVPPTTLPPTTVAPTTTPPVPPTT